MNVWTARIVAIAMAIVAAGHELASVSPKVALYMVTGGGLVLAFLQPVTKKKDPNQ